MKLGGYHLQLIGVAPEHQRKGVATSLAKYAEEKVSSYNHDRRVCIAAVAHGIVRSQALNMHVPTLLETVGSTNVSINTGGWLSRVH